MLLHNRTFHFRFALSIFLYNVKNKKTKDVKNLKTVPNDEKLPVFTNNQIPKKWNRVIIDINITLISTFCALSCARFVQFQRTFWALYSLLISTLFLVKKCFFFSRSKLFRTDRIYIKETCFNRESFLITRDEMFDWSP